MALADLHSAVVVDRDIDEASRVDPSLFDPIVRVEGAVPGTARPVAVVRVYQGPQGTYAEHFTLENGRGRELYASPVRQVQLRGEMFEDRFVSVLSDLRVGDADEHRARFFVDDVEVGDIPVFVEAGTGGDPYLAQQEAFAKALQKGTVAWLSVPQPPDRRRRPVKPHEQAVWFVLEGGKVYVLTGPGEQQVPGLADAPQVEVVVRSKEDRSSISRIPADVARVPADDPRFEAVGRAGLGKRLNLTDGDAALERWRRTCALYELSPRFRPGDAPPAGNGRPAATPPAPSSPAAAPDAPAEAPAPATPKPKAADVHVEVEVDREVYDKLIAEGKSDRVARAQAKAAFVRREKARLRAEQGDAEPT